MNDDHHDNRYEDGDDSTETVEDYDDWTTWEQVTTTARGLRPGDVIVRNGRRMKIKTVDNVDGFIEIQSENRELFYTLGTRGYIAWRTKASSTEQP